MGEKMNPMEEVRRLLIEYDQIVKNCYALIELVVK